MAREIALTRGMVAIVDDADYDRLSAFKWRVCTGAGKHHYAARYERGAVVLMHRELMQAPRGTYVDHVDGDTLNNVCANLRVCSPAQNALNAMKRSNLSSSRFKGVTLLQGRYWGAVARGAYLGCFQTEVDAACAYDAYAREHFGEFARLNFPKPGERSGVRADRTVTNCVDGQRS